MKKRDLLFSVIYIGIFIPLIISHAVYEHYAAFSREWAFTASFLKFALLATMGEMLGMRIRTGKYYSKDFGIIPRAIVWGILGVFTKAAFIIFSGGVPSIMMHLGMTDPAAIMAGGITVQKVALSFCISFFLNIFFAPVLMITHKVTDTHIVETGGSLRKFFSVVDTARILDKIDWRTMWGFVLKKTIPFFWIPAHTITFLLPSELQILFAAVLSTALGLILAFAANKRSDSLQEA
ncbi:MAG TPA: hypothetical protein PKH02_04960 [Bacteroidales bacterium]|mgnify:CR=1 FL=1|nr:hypothetical protein [Bacteroidales bacterium]